MLAHHVVCAGPRDRKIRGTTCQGLTLRLFYRLDLINNLQRTRGALSREVRGSDRDIVLLRGCQDWHGRLSENLDEQIQRQGPTRGVLDFGNSHMRCTSAEPCTARSGIAEVVRVDCHRPTCLLLCNAPPRTSGHFRRFMTLCDLKGFVNALQTADWAKRRLPSRQE